MSLNFFISLSKTCYFKNRENLCLVSLTKQQHIKRSKSQNQSWAKKAVRAEFDNYTSGYVIGLVHHFITSWEVDHTFICNSPYK